MEMGNWSVQEGARAHAGSIFVSSREKSGNGRRLDGFFLLKTNLFSMLYYRMVDVSFSPVLKDVKINELSFWNSPPKL